MPPKSRLGQNFLIDQQAIGSIVAAVGNCSGRTVVEIGPGKGAITLELAAKAAHVVAIEIDPELASKLAKTFSVDSRAQSASESRVTIETVDVLAFDFANASAAAGQRLIVVGNLPYYITSPILMKLAENSDALDRAVLMVQSEVAERVTAEPGSRDYGLLTVTVQMHGSVERLFTLTPRSFSPPPEVHSTVFRWRFAPRFQELQVDRSEFLGFLRKIFALKRKTLANNLRTAGFRSEIIPAAFAAIGIDFKVRAEALPVEELAALWRYLKMERVTPIFRSGPIS